MILNTRLHAATRSVVLVAVIYLYASVFASYAVADNDDVFNTVLATSYQHESNLFRLDSGSQPVGPGAERSDNILKTNIGFRINKHYSLQTFRFDFAHIENKYDNAKFLNFNANNYKAAWLWAITPELTGNLSSERTVDLVPYLDFRVTDRQNVRTRETQIVDFDWSPHGRWHLLGGFTKLEATNSQTFLQETSFKLDTVEAGIKYSFPSESFVAMKFRKRQGENQEISFSRFIGKGFEESEQELSAVWILTGKSRLTSNLGHNRRTDDTFSIRDFSGYFGGINYAWDITSKLNLKVDLSRKLAGFSDVSSTYTEYDVLSAKPTWEITSKILLSANALVGKRKFRGDGPVFAASEREDDMMSYGVALDWQPRNTMKFGITLQHDQRDSNVVNRDFSANSASINGQLTF